MDHTTEFENFYSEKIVPALPELRAECKKADGWGIAALVSGLLGFLSFLGNYTGRLDADAFTALIIFFGVILVISVYQYAQSSDEFTDDYKATIIKKIIDHISPGLVYKPGEMVRSGEYKTSGLYRYKHDYYDGDDYIEGMQDDVSFHCSELHTQCDDGGKNNQLTIFKGLFFVAAINSRFAGGTYLWPRNGAQLSSVMKEAYYRLPQMPHVVNIKFNDAAFDYMFRVGSTWPDQAREILTAERRNKIVNLCTAIKLPLSFSFAAGKCFIGVPLDEDLLEPTNYDPGDKEEIMKYFITIGLISNMVKQLGLSELL